MTNQSSWVTQIQLLLNTAPPKMALESLLRVLWHFWRYVECFSEFSESTGMCFEAFWKRSSDFIHLSDKSDIHRRERAQLSMLAWCLEGIDVVIFYEARHWIVAKCNEIRLATFWWELREELASKAPSSEEKTCEKPCKAYHLHFIVKVSINKKATQSDRGFTRRIRFEGRLLAWMREL